MMDVVKEGEAFQNATVDTRREAKELAKEGCCKRLSVNSVVFECFADDFYRVIVGGELRGTVRIKHL